MADYRNDLEAAHRKIAKLENELHAPPPVPRPPRAQRPLLAIVLGVCTGLFVLAATVSIFLVRVPTSLPRPEVTVPIEVAPPTLHVRWTSALGRAPVFADVNGDGTDEMIAILWNDARRDLPMWVAAIDTTTFTPRWRAGPFPGQEGDYATKLVVMKSKAANVVLLTESQGNVHAIDIATGKRAGDFAVGAPVTGVCIADDASGRASLARGFGGEHVTLDLRTRELATQRTPKPEFACHGGRGDLGFCGDAKVARPCISYAHVRGRTPFDPFTTFEGADVVLTSGLAKQRADATALERPSPFGVGADARTKAVRWEGPLSLPADRVHLGGDRSDFDGTHFVIGYQLVSGVFRVVARDVATGAVTWSTDLPGSREGSVLYSLGIHGELVFVDIDGQLEVFRLADASPVASIRSVDIVLPESEAMGLP
ncbi:MAG: hypothetical protein JWM74_3052 [Myxococcaceae bacterium]|nr:hypothetical protein [Myxococcaceae bacterium]